MGVGNCIRHCIYIKHDPASSVPPCRSSICLVLPAAALFITLCHLCRWTHHWAAQSYSAFLLTPLQNSFFPKLLSRTRSRKQLEEPARDLNCFDMLKFREGLCVPYSIKVIHLLNQILDSPKYRMAFCIIVNFGVCYIWSITRQTVRVPVISSS